MNSKRILCVLLTLVLIMTFLGPVSMVPRASAADNETLVQVTEPVIGESYYLAANVDGTMMYFRHGTISDTVPYSLVVTDNINHNWTSRVTLEDPTATYEKYTEGFQLTYINPTNSTLGRIYCMDSLTTTGNKGIMDTGVNSSTPYKNRHNFYVAEVNGVKVLKSTGNGHILVVKKVPQTVSGVTTNVWRMLGVPESELGNAGVYPAMLMTNHTHSYVDGICSCGKWEPVALQEGIYYLTGTVNGTTYYFRQTGTEEKVTYTTPYSVYCDTDKAKATLVDVISESDDGLSLAYPYNNTLARIYVYDVGNNGTIDTGVNTKNVAANHHFTWDADNAYLYQMEGTVKYVLALKELKNSNTNANQYRILAVPEKQLSNTVVPVRPEAHTQHSCDSWVVQTPATTNSTGIKTGTCTICGRQVQEVIPVIIPAFSGNSVSLQDSISLHFYVEKAAFADGAYQNPHVIFDMNGTTTTVSAYSETDESYIFTYTDITPDKMGEKVTATLYADKQDGTKFSATTQYSVAEHCYAVLEQENTGDALRTLVVDMLNFGAACQKYRNPDITDQELVNGALTEEQRSWGSSDPLRELESCRNAGSNDGPVTWYGVSALMGDRVQMRVYFAAQDSDGLTVQAQIAGNTWVLDDIKTKDGMYYVDFSQLAPTQMSEKVSFTVYKGETAVSSTLDYSLESYAAVWLSTEDASAEQMEMVKAMIRYGDAAKTYAQRSYDLQEDVLYLGRTYEANDTQWFNWSASGFSVRFQGSGLKAKIASNAPDATNYAYLKVYVDGVEQTDILLDQTMQTVTLAQGLDPNETHTVEVRKRNSARSSTAGLVNLELLDGAKLVPPEAKERLIEFVGDSLTVGYSAADVNKTETGWSTKTEDGTKTYAKQVADAFGAEYMVTAISGRGVVMNNSGGSGYLLPDIYPELDIYNNPGIAYDFAQQPDVIVINLGTNDATNSGLDIEVFKTGATNFLQLVRQKNPNATIIWAYGMRNDKMTTEVDKALAEVIAGWGDDNVYYLQLDLATEMHLNHPTAAAYAPAGEKLIEKIEEITGW